MRTAWLVSILLLVLPVSANPQANQKLDALQGRISGIVLNEEGQPMPGVSVCTTVSRKNEGTTECRVMTDQNGHFEIVHMPMGTFGVHAAPEGYDMSDQRVQSVKLTTEEPAANVTVRLGRKAAILSGSVRDKFTQKPVARFSFIALADDERGTFTTSSQDGAFRLTVPSGTDITVAVTAKGYKSAFYPESLNLQSGEEKSIDIELEPKTQN